MGLFSGNTKATVSFVSVRHMSEVIKKSSKMNFKKFTNGHIFFCSVLINIINNQQKKIFLNKLTGVLPFFLFLFRFSSFINNLHFKSNQLLFQQPSWKISFINGCCGSSCLAQKGHIEKRPCVLPCGTLTLLQYLHVHSLAMWPHGTKAYGLKQFGFVVVSALLTLISSK